MFENFALCPLLYSLKGKLQISDLLKSVSFSFPRRNLSTFIHLEQLPGIGACMDVHDCLLERR